MLPLPIPVSTEKCKEFLKPILRRLNRVFAPRQRQWQHPLTFFSSRDANKHVRCKSHSISVCEGAVVEWRREGAAHPCTSCIASRSCQLLCGVPPALGKSGSVLKCRTERTRKGRKRHLAKQAPMPEIHGGDAKAVNEACCTGRATNLACVGEGFLCCWPRGRVSVLRHRPSPIQAHWPKTKVPLVNFTCRISNSCKALVKPQDRRLVLSEITSMHCRLICTSSVACASTRQRAHTHSIRPVCGVEN